MNFVCIKDCNNEALTLFKTERVFYYRKGMVYDYAFSDYYTRASIKKASDNTYLGFVTNDFVSENFMPQYEYNRILGEVDKMYENLLINNNG